MRNVCIASFFLLEGTVTFVANGGIGHQVVERRQQPAGMPTRGPIERSHLPRRRSNLKVRASAAR